MTGAARAPNESSTRSISQGMMLMILAMLMLPGIDAVAKLVRWLVQTASALSMQFLAGIFGLITMSVALAFGDAYDIWFIAPVWPTLMEWQLLALLGIIATTGHVLVVLAYSRAPVAVLAPFQYLEIVSATTLGFLIFNDLPDPLTWVGIVIIVSSGLFVFYRERKLSKHATSKSKSKRARNPGVVRF